MPNKQFVKQTVLEKSQDYLGRDVSYKRTVEHEGRNLQYAVDENQAVTRGKDPLPILAPSTVWRWLSWLGGQTTTLRKVSELIRQKDPNCQLHREPLAFSSKKYRSEQRHKVLVRAGRLLLATGIFAKLFGKDIFPQFAIVTGPS